MNDLLDVLVGAMVFYLAIAGVFIIIWVVTNKRNKP